jgi:hypothetical protein
MPESRDRKLMVSVEPIIHELVVLLTKGETKSISSYVRALIIEDLLVRNVLTEADLKALVLA